MEITTKKSSLKLYLAVYFMVLCLVFGMMLPLIAYNIKIFLPLETTMLSSLSVILLFVNKNNRLLTNKEITEFSLKVFFILLAIFSLLLVLFLSYLFYFSSWMAGILLGLGIIFVVGFWAMLFSSIILIPILSLVCLYFYQSLIKKSVSLQEGIKKIRIISFAVCFFDILIRSIQKI